MHIRMGLSFTAALVAAACFSRATPDAAHADAGAPLASPSQVAPAGGLSGLPINGTPRSALSFDLASAVVGHHHDPRRSGAYVATIDIVTAPAVYTTAKGTYVVFNAQNSAVGTACPLGQAGDLVALRMVDGAPPRIETAWCMQNGGHGAPMVTTTDGTSESIVWVTADTTARLHGYNGETGELLFNGGGASQQIAGLKRFNTVIAVHNRIIVAADDGLYAFTR